MTDASEFEIHWLEEVKNNVLQREDGKITLGAAKTPSGSIHVGILRETITCDCLKRLIEGEGRDVRFIFSFDSMDAAKKFPPYIPDGFHVHVGKPLSDIPCPVKGCGCESYAHHWGNELVSTFKDFGLDPVVTWSHEVYETPEMKKYIKLALDNTTTVRQIISRNILPTLDDEKRAKYEEQMRTWYPAMVVCSKCGTTQYNDKKAGKIFANRIIDYGPGTGELTYECPNPACGNVEKTTIDDARVKLNWRVDWPAKWAMFKVTCEPAGKDHSVKGGSYDTGLELCREVFGYEGPLKVPYEWLRLGDQDMSTSAGIVFNPKEYLKVGALPEAFRHLIVKTKPMAHISFRIENLPQMFDDYERYEKIYYGFEEATPEEMAVTRYTFPLVVPGAVPGEIPTRLPFRYAVLMSQLQELIPGEETVVEKVNAASMKASPAKSPARLQTAEILDFLEKAKYWVQTYAPENLRFNVSKDFDDKVKDSLSQEEKQALGLLLELLVENEFDDDQALQNNIFDIAKEKTSMKPAKVFQAIYKVFLGKKFGPRLGPFLLALEKDFVVKRLKEAIS